MSHAEFAIGGATAQTILADGEKVTIFDLGVAGCLTPNPNGRYGFCSVHIDVWDVDELPFNEGARANAMLLCDVRYATARGGGEFTLDCTRGRVFSVGGCDVIHIAAYFVSAITGEAIHPFATKRVQATVEWPTSISPKEIGLTLPSVDLALLDGVPVASAWFKIPRQADSVLVYTPQPALLPTLQLEFAHSNAAGTPVRYATLNPNANGTAIRHGVEFLRFVQTAAVTQTVFPDFTLVP